MEKRILVRSTDITAFRLRCTNDECGGSILIPVSASHIQYPEKCTNCSTHYYPPIAELVDKNEFNAIHNLREITRRSSTNQVGVELILEVEYTD